MVLHVFRFGKTDHNSIRWCLLLCIQFYILFYIYATGISCFLIFWRFIHPCLLFITVKKQSDKKGRYAHLLLLTLCSVSHSNFLPPPPNLIYILAIPYDNLFTAPSTVLKINIIFISWTTVTNDLYTFTKTMTDDYWYVFNQDYSKQPNSSYKNSQMNSHIWRLPPFPFPPSHFGDTSALLLDWLLCQCHQISQRASTYTLPFNIPPESGTHSPEYFKTLFQDLFQLFTPPPNNPFLSNLNMWEQLPF